MKLPNPLESKFGRLSTFFFLYLTEGIPHGFTSVAIATQMRRQGVGPAAIGTFIASLYWPWALKFTIGPFVDVLYSDRLGRRRMWIVMAQVMMVLTLLASMPVDFSTEIKLFIAIIFIHNIFAATQDVAIDALACSVLKEDERGLANGLMFAGAYLGAAVGGSGVLFLTGYMNFNLTFFFVAGGIMTVTLLVSLRLKERPTEVTHSYAGKSAIAAAWGEIRQYVADALRAFFGTRAAFVGMIFALLPMGGYALGLLLVSNLAVEFGMSDAKIGRLTLFSAIIAALGCVVGGFLSDRFGRKRMLALYLLGTAIPTLYLAFAMNAHGWIMPIKGQLPAGIPAPLAAVYEVAMRPIPPPALITTFWTATLVYSAFQGLMYGTRTALFMDITTPAVAATQFTAYMALLNVALAYSARWQGLAIEAWGYPIMLVIDVGAGLICILLLPLMASQSPRDDSQ